jgi:acyl-CoA hydrolase
VSADEAVKVVRSGDRVFLHTAAATPRRLVEAMTARAGELSGVEVLSLHTEGEAPYAAPEHAASFRVNALFVGPNVRQAIDEGRGDFIPIFLSDGVDPVFVDTSSFGRRESTMPKSRDRRTRRSFGGS